MLTIGKPMKRWSIRYYNDTANQAKQATIDRQRANGGLGEYYSEGDTREPTWLVVGDKAVVGEITGLDGAALVGGSATTEAAAKWLDDGVAPSGATGRAFTQESVHGFDLTFAAPKSVSLLRALTGDLGEKAVQVAHVRAVEAAMTYLHDHAGYTRVHNKMTGNKDLVRLPGLTAIMYQHETSRCGDPHLHTHVILPNRQARADGKLVSIDSKSLHHEAKAAGTIYQAVLRRELYAERNFEWNLVDEHSGMAEIAGVTKRCLKAWSQRSTRLREWAMNNLKVVDGELTAAQLAAAQKATRPAKPESLSWPALKEEWRGDSRGLELDRDAHYAARDARRAAARAPLDRARVADMAARIDKAAFTRADLVEIIGAQLPYDVDGDPRELIESMVDEVRVRVSETRGAHHREGHEKFTIDAVIREETRVLDMIDESDNRARLDIRSADIGDLSPDQERAIRNIAVSPFLVQPLQAPAGAGKTHSLKALRSAAQRSRKDVLVLAPTGKAVDEALSEGAGDRGLTVAKALKLIADRELKVDQRTLIVVDEASMVGTPELKKLLSCATVGRAKMVLVGDAYQLSPVKARGGMFEQIWDELPWAQRLGEVWRMQDPAERDASLAVRSGQGNRLRKAVGWYRNHERLHTGDPIAMAHDALEKYLADYHADRATPGKDRSPLLVCDTWEMANALNLRLHRDLTDASEPAVLAARDQHIRAGDIVISRKNDVSIEVRPAPGEDSADQVRNGNRWRVAAVDAANGRIAVERLGDNKGRAVFEGDYLREHVTLGYAVTLHSAQGVTAHTCYSVFSDRATRSMAYVGMTRGRANNEAFIYQHLGAERDHDHSHVLADTDVHQMRRGNKHAAAHYFRMILANDDRPRTMHVEANRTDRDLLPDPVVDVLRRNDQRIAARRAVWKAHQDTGQAIRAAYNRMTEKTRTSRETPDRGLDRDL